MKKNLKTLYVVDHELVLSIMLLDDTTLFVGLLEDWELINKDSVLKISRMLYVWCTRTKVVLLHCQNVVLHYMCSDLAGSVRSREH